MNAYVIKNIGKRAISTGVTPKAKMTLNDVWNMRDNLASALNSERLQDYLNKKNLLNEKE